MTSVQSITFFFVAIFLATGESFFLYSSKKTNQERGGMHPQYYRDVNPPQQIQMPWQSQYTYDGAGGMTVALPVAVPFQSQMGSIPSSLKGTVHNVQLVPCLCPITKELEPQQVMQQQQSPPSYVIQGSPPTTTQN